MELEKHTKPKELTELPSILDKRGRFSITHATTIDNPEAIKKVMAHMVVTRCEYMFDFYAPRFEYMALSDLFDKVEQGYMAPEYIITINDKGNISAERLTILEHEIGFVSAKEIREAERFTTTLNKINNKKQPLIPTKNKKAGPSGPFTAGNAQRAIEK